MLPRYQGIAVINMPAVALNTIVTPKNFKLETRMMCQLVHQLNFFPIFEKIAWRKLQKFDFMKCVFIIKFIKFIIKLIKIVTGFISCSSIKYTCQTKSNCSSPSRPPWTQAMLSQVLVLKQKTQELDHKCTSNVVDNYLPLP